MNYQRDLKKLLKVALISFIVSFLIINWNDVSWIFNYKVIKGLIEDFFTPYPSIENSYLKPYFYLNETNKNQISQDNLNEEDNLEIVKDAISFPSNKNNLIEIPKLSISAPLVFSTTTDINVIRKDLDRGVVYYPGSVKPGERGQIIILGHSAPPNWPKVKYDWIFSEINKLEVGDLIFLHYDYKQYNFIVKQKNIVKKGGDLPSINQNTNNLLLISCWPPGKDYQRIVVSAEIQKR